MPFSGSPTALYPAGHKLIDSEMQTWYDTLVADGTYADFSSSLSWTQATTNPTLGNGSKRAEYRQVGDVVTYSGQIVLGSTTSLGSGIFQLNYPVTPTSAANTRGGIIGVAYVDDNSASATWSGVIRSASSTVLQIIVTNAAATGLLDPTHPMTWATSDRFSWSIQYQAA